MSMFCGYSDEYDWTGETPKPPVIQVTDWDGELPVGDVIEDGESITVIEDDRIVFIDMAMMKTTEMGIASPFKKLPSKNTGEYVGCVTSGTTETTLQNIKKTLRSGVRVFMKNSYSPNFGCVWEFYSPTK